MQFNRQLIKHNNQLRPKRKWAVITIADLNDAGLTLSAGSEDGAKIKIVRQDHLIVLSGVIHKVAVWRISLANCSPMCCFMAM